MNTWLDASDSSLTTDRYVSCSCARTILCTTGTFNGATKAAQGLSCGPWGKLIGATSRTLRMGLTGHGHVSATASCRWVSWGAKHNGTVTVTIVVSLVILSRMDFEAVRSQNRSSLKWF